MYVPILEEILTILNMLKKVMSREEYRNLTDSMSTGVIDEKTLDIVKEAKEKWIP